MVVFLQSGIVLAVAGHLGQCRCGPSLRGACFVLVRVRFTPGKILRVRATNERNAQRCSPFEVMIRKGRLLESLPGVLTSPAWPAALSGSAYLMDMTEADKRVPDLDERRWSALMVSAQAGNESDYRQLLTEVVDVIDNYLRRRFGSHDFVEDCVQEALIAMHRARHTYDPHRDFRPWLYAIVRNKAIDFFRRQSTRAKAHDHYRTEQEILSQPGRPSAATGEISELGILAGLSEPHREVLVLTKVVGFSIAETAGKLGISESAVKVRVHRAVRKLRRLLEADDAEAGAN